MKRLKHWSTGLLVAAALGGISTQAAARTLEVITSIGILADVVSEVGGDHVHVRTLVPSNGDPHEYEPSPDDVKALKAADLSFINGEGLETWFPRLAKAAGTGKQPVIASAGIKTREMEEDGEVVTDPHVWNSAANVLVWVDNIEKALSAASPGDSADFKANAANYAKTVRELDAYAHSLIDPVPAERRKVLTSHDALGYFGQEYGITFLAPIGLSTEEEASAADVSKLIDQIRKEKVKVYFIENSTDSRLVKQIADATGAEPGGELYVEALSDADGPAPTYARMFRHNVDEIVSAISK